MARSTAALVALPLILAAGFVLPIEATAQQTADRLTEDGHMVESGDYLWNLARTYYEDPFQWRRIYEANRDQINDPDLIYPGQELMIPGFGMIVVGQEDGPDADGAQAAGGRANGGAGADAARRAQAPAASNAVASSVYPGLGDPTVFSDPPRTDTPTPGNRTTFYGSLGGSTLRGGGVLAADQVEHLAVASDVFYSSPWIVDEGREQSAIYPGVVDGWAGAQSSQREDASIYPFDLIHINWREGSPPSVGTMLQLVRVVRSQEGFGHVIQPTGLGRVVERGAAGVTVEVTDAFRRPRSGDYALVAPAFELRPGQYAVEGDTDLPSQLLGFATDRRIQQIGDVAFLAVGTQDGVSVGDIFRARTGQAEHGGDDRAFSLQVVRVFGDRASARITDVRVPVFPANARVERALRMP